MELRTTRSNFCLDRWRGWTVSWWGLWNAGTGRQRGYFWLGCGLYRPIDWRGAARGRSNLRLDLRRGWAVHRWSRWVQTG